MWGDENFEVDEILCFVVVNNVLFIYFVYKMGFKIVVEGFYNDV